MQVVGVRAWTLAPQASSKGLTRALLLSGEAGREAGNAEHWGRPGWETGVISRGSNALDGLLIHSCKASSGMAPARHDAPAGTRRRRHSGPQLARGQPRTDAARQGEATLALLLHAAVEPLLERSGADVAVGVTQVELAADLGGNLVCTAHTAGGKGRGSRPGGHASRARHCAAQHHCTRAARVPRGRAQNGQTPAGQQRRRA